ncbi:hypothetical protein NMD1_04113 [Novosphingobium sp. MD-1]|nr:hypothetical protein NMD1_04113 [Novosphingobium sp. MD-1]
MTAGRGVLAASPFTPYLPASNPHIRAKAETKTNRFPSKGHL